MAEWEMTSLHNGQTTPNILRNEARNYTTPSKMSMNTWKPSDAVSKTHATAPYIDDGYSSVFEMFRKACRTHAIANDGGDGGVMGRDVL